MPPSARLGGFKILKDVVRISMVFSGETAYSPARFFRVISEREVNLPYVVCVPDKQIWGLDIMVEDHDEIRISSVLRDHFGDQFQSQSGSAILSLFPHRRNPEITGSLLEVFGQEGLKPESFANSPSAISVVIEEDLLNKAGDALFEPFSFSAYRTPADWKLAQKGKEQLYKEVVASYQEQKPKVYGLEYHEGQALIQLTSDSWNVAQLGVLLKGFARLGLYLSFLVKGPSEGKEKIMFCLPASDDYSYEDMIDRATSGISIVNRAPVVVFSMNGPHFGDRYGIVAELLSTFEKNEIELLGLSCTIASITGVLPAEHLDSAIHAINECFEVPSVTKKE
jgi:aspartokinase